MPFRLVPKSSPVDDLECCTFEFSRNFASKRCLVLYSDSPGGATIPTLSRADLCVSWAFLFGHDIILSRSRSLVASFNAEKTKRPPRAYTAAFSVQFRQFRTLVLRVSYLFIYRTYYHTKRTILCRAVSVLNY